MIHHQTIDSPLGPVSITASASGVRSLYFMPATAPDQPNALTRQCAEELKGYFSGTLQRFTTPLDQQGTDFQCKVWQALLEIPYGQVASYRDIANSIGQPKAVRAVGAANGRNPISIIVPCHRVIGANGSLTGYAGGLERKQYLLQLEAQKLFRSPQSACSS